MELVMIPWVSAQPCPLRPGLWAWVGRIPAATLNPFFCCTSDPIRKEYCVIRPMRSDVCDTVNGKGMAGSQLELHKQQSTR